METDICGGPLSFEYSQQELKDMLEEEKRKIDAEKEEIERSKQEERDNEALQNKLKEEEREKEAENQRKLKEKKKEPVRDPDYIRTMAMIEETQRKNQEVKEKKNNFL